MQTAYFVAMLVGVAWLMVWSILPPSRTGRGWWPFDMAEDDADGGGAAGRGADREGSAGPVHGDAGPARAPGSWRDRRSRADGPPGPPSPRHSAPRSPRPAEGRIAPTRRPR